MQITPPAPQIPKKKLDFITAIGGAFAAIAAVLAVRVILLLSVIGAFVLGEIAMQSKDVYSLWVLGIFCGFTMPILSYLDIQTRRK